MTDLAHILIDHAVVAIVHGIQRVQRDRLAEALKGEGAVAHLMGNDSKQIQRACVEGIPVQGMPTDGCGVLQIAIPEVAKRVGKLLTGYRSGSV